MTARDSRVPTPQLIKIGLVLTVVFLALGSVRFARYNWSGLPLDRAPVTGERQVGPCLERIKPYTTASGRVIKPVVVDEMQYLALVEYFRGVPQEDLQVTCLYDPFTFRSAMSWLAHWLPFDEALSLGLTNTFMSVAGIWLILLTLREQGFDTRVMLAVGLLCSVSWNPFYFGTAILIDSGVVAALALCWYLLAKRRPWLTLPIVAVGYTLRDTFGVFLVVLLAWCWKRYRSGERSALPAAAPALTAIVLFVGSIAFWRGFLPEPAAAWDVTPDLGAIASNLGDPIGLASFAVGVLPLLLPAIFVYRRRAGASGPIAPLFDPATVGVIMALGISFWTLITVDLTPRMFWIAFPFAATLAAEWFSEGRPRQWLDSLGGRGKRTEPSLVS